MTVSTDQKKIEQLLNKGTVDLIVKEDLEKKLKSGKKLRIKLGIDPSGSNLHIGHMVVVRKLREFQELGHHIMLLFGNFTGQIGDPTGKSETRAPKTQDQLEKNAKHYIDQVKKILDVEKIEVMWNADWLAPLNFADVVQLASHFTVAQMMERDMFQERVKKAQPISMHEFFYPLMQGYDSVAMKADVELGGTDQTFNLLAGRTIQKAYNQSPQNILTVPLLEGTDGVKKMGKSEGNYIGVSDSPKEIYGKTMSIPDNLILKYFELATNDTLEEIKKHKKALDEGENPINFKKLLAHKIVEIYYDTSSAEQAAQEFTNIFKNKGLPDNIPEFNTKKETIEIIEALALCKLVSSNSDARRMIEQGAVKINGEKIENIKHQIELNEEKLLQVGKRKFARLNAAQS